MECKSAMAQWRNGYFCSLVLVLILLVLPACSTASDKLVLKKSSFSEISGWDNDNHAAALGSFIKSCKKFKSLPKNKPAHSSGIAGTYGNWADVCRKIHTSDNAQSFFESNFTPYLATNRGNPRGTFTGYFEIEIEGSRTKHGEYKYPIYSKPSDMKSGNKHYSRQKIEDGVLKGQGLEIAWVKDPVRLFFLHVQGSGLIRLEDSSIMRIGYNGKNGHNYVSIGRHMIEQNYLSKENVSAESIKEWLYDHPDKMTSIFNHNPSYIFFRETEASGPIGGQGVQLTAMRSLAIDKKFMPYGAPVWVDVNLNGNENASFRKLLIAQDTGSAIKGPVRGDLFFGSGKKAEKLAGHQNNKGRYFILLPKDDHDR